MIKGCASGILVPSLLCLSVLFCLFVYFLQYVLSCVAVDLCAGRCRKGNPKKNLILFRVMFSFSRSKTRIRTHCTTVYSCGILPLQNSSHETFHHKCRKFHLFPTLFFTSPHLPLGGCCCLTVFKLTFWGNVPFSNSRFSLLMCMVVFNSLPTKAFRRKVQPPQPILAHKEETFERQPTVVGARKVGIIFLHSSRKVIICLKSFLRSSKLG